MTTTYEPSAWMRERLGVVMARYRAAIRVDPDAGFVLATIRRYQGPASDTVCDRCQCRDERVRTSRMDVPGLTPPLTVIVALCRDCARREGW